MKKNNILNLSTTHNTIYKFNVATNKLIKMKSELQDKIREKIQNYKKENNG